MTAIVEKSSSYVLGIDLGTTNCAASIYKAGKTEVININGSKTMPSVMSVLKDGEILVGTQAKSRSLIAPESTVSSIKLKKSGSRQFFSMTLVAELLMFLSLRSTPREMQINSLRFLRRKAFRCWEEMILIKGL